MLRLQCPKQSNIDDHAEVNIEDLATRSRRRSIDETNPYVHAFYSPPPTLSLSFCVWGTLNIYKNPKKNSETIGASQNKSIF